MELIEQIAEAVLELAPERTGELAGTALQAGAQPADIIDKGIAKGMEAVCSGRRPGLRQREGRRPDVSTRQPGTRRCAQDGSPQEVEEACRQVIPKAAPGGGFILGSSGSVARFTPLENLEAMVRACERYGTYPLAGG